MEKEIASTNTMPPTPPGSICSTCGSPMSQYDITCPQCRKAEALTIQPADYARERPKSVTVVAIILLAFAALGVFNVLNMMFSIKTQQLVTAGMTFQDMLPQYILSGLTTISMLVMGIGLLRLVPWARLLTIYGLIVLAVFGLVMQVIFMPRQIAAMTSTIPSDAPMPISIETMMWIGVVISTLVGWAINGVFIYLLTRPNVVQAFQESRERA